MTIKKLHKLEDSYTSQHDNLFLDRSWYMKKGKVRAKHHQKRNGGRRAVNRLAALCCPAVCLNVYWDLPVHNMLHPWLKISVCSVKKIEFEI